MGWLARLLLATLLLVTATVAGAEPAGNTGFVPVRIGRGTAAGTVVVVAGDHLWSISKTHVERILGRTAAPEEVAGYWRLVVDANRDGLLSGDPDLIYPGEVIDLPRRG